VVSDGRLIVCYRHVRPTASRLLTLPTLALALIPRAVALNLALGAIVNALKLPVYLDSVGTLLAAALAGPLAGMITGALSNLVLGLLVNPALLAFIPVAMIIGLIAGIAGRLGAFNRMTTAALAGLVIGVAAALSSVPIVIVLYGGLTPTGAGVVTMVLRSVFPLTMEQAAKIASLSTDVIDKPLSALLVAAILARLPARITARFRTAP